MLFLRSPTAFCSVIFCEATAIYGVILAIILTNKTQLPDSSSIPHTDAGFAAFYTMARFAGYAIFWAGLGVGLTNLGSGCVSIRLLRARRPALFAGCFMRIMRSRACHAVTADLRCTRLLLCLCLRVPSAPAAFAWALLAPLAPWLMHRTLPSSSRS